MENNRVPRGLVLLYLAELAVAIPTMVFGVALLSPVVVLASWTWLQVPVIETILAVLFTMAGSSVLLGFLLGWHPPRKLAGNLRRYGCFTVSGVYFFSVIAQVLSSGLFPLVGWVFMAGLCATALLCWAAERMLE